MATAQEDAEAVRLMGVIRGAMERAGGLTRASGGEDNTSAEEDALDEVSDALRALKPILAAMDSLPPCYVATPNAREERMLAREVLEMAVVFSLRRADKDSFEKYIAQLLPMYQDFSDSLPESEHFSLILGLWLFFLVVENRLAEFHSHLELLSQEQRTDPCIAFPIRIEQQLMVGSYDKVLAAGEAMPHPAFQFFMASLLPTVREEIAECTKASYETLTLDAAMSLLMFTHRDRLMEFIQENYPEWVISGENILLKDANATTKSEEIPSMRVIAETLSYATELERIV